MRKYRFGDPEKGSIWGRRLRIFSFFLCWNAFGMVCYSWWKTREKRKDPEYQQLTGVQKYLYFMNLKGDNIKHIRVKGVSSVESRTITFDEALKPGGLNKNKEMSTDE